MEPRKLTTKEVLVASISLAIGATGGAIANDFSDPGILTTQQVIESQEAKLVEGKEYEQILSGGTKPGDAADKTVVKDFPTNMRVEVYDGPKGKGYTVIEELPSRTVHLSYGPESTDRTFIINKEELSTSTATSTKLR